jgi:hypothetical protein
MLMKGTGIEFSLYFDDALIGHLRTSDRLVQAVHELLVGKRAAQTRVLIV